MKISKNVKMWAIAVLTLAMGAFSALVAPQAMAYRCLNGEDKTNMSDCPEYGDTEIGRNNNLDATLRNGTNLAIGVIGFIAVVMIIYGGFAYTTSAGDSAKVTKAKNIIMYGIVGLVVALLAFAIVNFVLTGLFKKA